MRPQFYVQYENTNLRKMTAFQRLLFTYVLGLLSLEDNSIVGKNAGIEVLKPQYNSLQIKFVEINPKLIADYINSFPLANITKEAYNLVDDTLFIDHTELFC